jgi:hypothetical protein
MGAVLSSSLDGAGGFLAHDESSNIEDNTRIVIARIFAEVIIRAFPLKLFLVL